MRFLRKWAPFFLLGAFFQDQHCTPLICRPALRSKDQQQIKPLALKFIIRGLLYSHKAPLKAGPSCSRW